MGADSILFATAHRPWPAPMAPWIMTQRWNDLLFLHYALAAGSAAAAGAGCAHARHLPAARVGLGHAVLDQSSAAAGSSLAAVVFAFCRNQRAHLRHARRQTGRVFLQPGRQQFVGSVGRARVLSPALLAGGHEAEGTRRTQDRLRLQAAARAQAGRTALLVRAEFAGVPGASRARSNISSPSVIACTPASRKRLYRGEIHHLPWELQEATVELAENSMAQPAGISLPPQPEIAYFARELKVLFWAPERLL